MKTADYYFHNTTKMRELRPVLCVVAGPNGSGKTSTTEKLLANEWTADSLYINPDNIAQEEFGDWNSQDAVLKAAQKATQLRYDCLESRNYPYPRHTFIPIRNAWLRISAYAYDITKKVVSISMHLHLHLFYNPPPVHDSRGGACLTYVLQWGYNKRAPSPAPQKPLSGSPHGESEPRHHRLTH